MAMALEKYNLHQKVALKLLQYIGARPKMLMLGFMIISFFISMWISNTATTSLMVRPFMIWIFTQKKQLTNIVYKTGTISISRIISATR